MKYLQFTEERKNTPQNLIITGCARSGTTLLQTLMAFFKDIKIYNYSETRPEKLLARLSEKPCENSPKKYLLIKKPQPHPADPRHFTLTSLLQKGFLIINIIRDGRDVLVSRHPEDPARYWVTPERWLAAINDTLKEKHNKRILVVKYELLVENPGAVLDQIADFLGVPCKKDFLNFYKNPRVADYLNTTSLQGARPVNADSVGAWKKLEHSQRMDEINTSRGEELNRALRELGYIQDQDEWTGKLQTQ